MKIFYCVDGVIMKTPEIHHIFLDRKKNAINNDLSDDVYAFKQQ